MTNEEFRTEAPALLKQWHEDLTKMGPLLDPGEVSDYGIDCFCLGWCISKGMSAQQAMNFRVKAIIG